MKISKNTYKSSIAIVVPSFIPNKKSLKTQNLRIKSRLISLFLQKNFRNLLKRLLKSQLPTLLKLIYPPPTSFTSPTLQEEKNNLTQTPNWINKAQNILRNLFLMGHRITPQNYEIQLILVINHFAYKTLNFFFSSITYVIILDIQIRD